jgi:hypothetical protein
MPLMSDTAELDAVCVYCGSTERLTDDHIPPKTLFPRPRPFNLITVRSCRKCNEGASKDDEYFRLMLSMRHDTGDQSAVKQILPSIYRSLQRSAQKGFQQAVFDSMNEVDILSTSGIYLGTADGYNVDLTRLDRVATRITTGLFYHEFGKHIPADFRVITYSADGIVNADTDAKTRIIKMFDKVTSDEPRVFGDRVFVYWFKPVVGHDTMSAWVLAVYERVVFLCFVAPK